MKLTKYSPCGRFVVVDGLYLDRDVSDALERWALDRGLCIQDAIQLALCALEDGALAQRRAPQCNHAPGYSRDRPTSEWTDELLPMPSEGEH